MDLPRLSKTGLARNLHRRLRRGFHSREAVKFQSLALWQ
jgi:hypothetical protein